MTNDDNEKEIIVAISNEENRENGNLTVENVQNYILAQRAEKTVKTENDLSASKGFFP